MDDQSQGMVTSGSEPPQQPGLRFLEITVYVMGGLLILMLVGLIGGIIWKVSHRSETPREAAKVFGAGIAPGTEIGAMTLDGDRLAVRAGSEIVIIDVRKGMVIDRIRLFEP
jgi:hypothetical protein